MITKSTFKIHPFYYITAFISAITGNFRPFVIFSIIIIAHEFGHLSIALLFNWKVYEVIILPFGGMTIFNEDINRPLIEEFLILIFGPLFQIIFTIIYSTYKYDPLFINYSIILLLFNLLPIYPLDGSKILNIILNKFLSFKLSHLITIYISFLCLIILLFFDFNLIFFLIMSLIFIKVFDEFKNHNNIFNRFLLERYTKKFNFKKIKVIHDNNVSAMKRDYRHIFYNKKRYYTEKEILQKRFDFNRKTW